MPCDGGSLVGWIAGGCQPDEKTSTVYSAVLVFAASNGRYPACMALTSAGRIACDMSFRIRPLPQVTTGVKAKPCHPACSLGSNKIKTTKWLCISTFCCPDSVAIISPIAGEEGRCLATFEDPRRRIESATKPHRRDQIVETRHDLTPRRRRIGPKLSPRSRLKPPRPQLVQQRLSLRLRAMITMSVRRCGFWHW